ncbi:MAG TPA: ATPase, T2SS/T4P/T4SS family [Kofleriaceae bacterium]|nr:ATPase, T2SS/T4P/T4SS family [Kofleriaceae bacterium]
MFAIVITEKGGEQRRIVFNKPEVTIGRVQGNDIVLPKGNVSKRHARIVLKDGKFIIVDLKSTNGTYVNGRKITSPLVVKEADKIYIGDFIMGVEESAAGGMDEGPTSEPPPPPTPPARMEAPPPPPMGGMGGGMGGPGAMGAPPGPPPPAASPELLRAALQRQEPPRPAGDGPMGGQMGGPPPPRGPATLPPPGPIGPPPPGAEPRTRPPRPAPGGTLPPPMGGSMGGPPPPIAPAPASTAVAPVPGPMGGGGMGPPPPAPPPPMSPPMGGLGAGGPIGPPPPAPMPSLGGPPPPAPMPAMAPPPAVAPIMAAAPGAAAPMAAHVLPGPGAAAAVPRERPRLVGAGARKIAPRPVAPPLRRGVALEPLDPKVIKMLDLQTQILERLRPKLDLDNIPVERLGDEDLWQKAERAIVDLVETLESSGELPKYVDQDSLIKETLNEALGLGPLEDLLADDKIDEILVDRRDRLVVGKDGQLRGSGKAFSSDDVLRRVVERLVAPTGSPIDDEHPFVDVRLRDGSRLTAVVPPVAVHGPSLTLRKPVRVKKTLNDLVSSGAMSAAMADFLGVCVVARRNVVVCGAPGVGKASLVSALVGSIPDGERIVTVEEVAELSIDRDDWIALETRPSDGKNGVTAVDLGHLVRSALRMRPDRLIVGDVRGGEALDLGTALGASVDGAVVALTGDGPQAALARWVALAQLAASSSSEPAVRELVAGAADVVVHVARFADGGVRVISVDEILGVREVGFDTQTLFSYRGAGTGDDGGFGATGAVPRFWAELDARGIKADAAIFKG